MFHIAQERQPPTLIFGAFPRFVLRVAILGPPPPLLELPELQADKELC